MKKLNFLILLVLITQNLLFCQTAIKETSIQEIMVLTNEGEIDKALHLIDSLRNSNPIRNENYLMLLMASTELNMKTFNVENVIKDNQEIISFDPEYELDCQNKIATYKKYLGDYEGAIISHKRVLELDPKDEISFNNMSSVYNLLGKFDDAIRILNSNPSKEHRSLEFYNYAFAFYNLNKLDSAKQYIDKYLQFDDAKKDFLGYKLASEIYSGLSDRKSSCIFITKANDIIKETNPKNQISLQSQRIQEYAIIKESLKDINETIKLKDLFCQ